MNVQKRDMIIGQRQVWGDAPIHCDCGKPTEPFSCYCAACENRMEQAAEYREQDRAEKAGHCRPGPEGTPVETVPDGAGRLPVSKPLYQEKPMLARRIKIGMNAQEARMILHHNDWLLLVKLGDDEQWAKGDRRGIISWAGGDPMQATITHTFYLDFLTDK